MGVAFESKSSNDSFDKYFSKELDLEESKCFESRRNSNSFTWTEWFCFKLHCLRIIWQVFGSVIKSLSNIWSNRSEEQFFLWQVFKSHLDT